MRFRRPFRRFRLRWRQLLRRAIGVRLANQYAGDLAGDNARLEELNRSLGTAIKIEKAKNQVLTREKELMAAVIARDFMRYKAETAVSARTVAELEVAKAKK